MAARALLFFVLLLPLPAAALEIVETLDEFNGRCLRSPCTVGTFLVPDPDLVISATLEGTFGNSNVPNTAPVELLVGGVMVAECRASDPCFSSSRPVAWHYEFDESDMPIIIGSLTKLKADQTGGRFPVRLGETTLTLTIIPEPSTLLLLASGLLALGRLRSRARA